MAYYEINKEEEEVLVGDEGGYNVTQEAPEFILTTHGTVDPGTDGGSTDTFVTASVPLAQKSMNGKKITAFLNITTQTVADLRSAATEAFTFYTSNTATITITDFTELNTGDKVNLIATDTNNYDFVNGDQSSVLGTWESTTSNEATATNLMNVINTTSGPSGSRFTATVDGAVVTVTQAVAGAAGATTVTLTDSGTAGMTKTNFVSNYSTVDGATITLIDAAGTSATFTGRNATTVPMTDEFLLVASSDTTAENFIVSVNANSILITASRSGSVVTCTQDVKGSAGNTTITVSSSPDFNSLTSANAIEFSSGGGIDMFMEFSPDGTNWTLFSISAKDSTGVTLAENIDTQTIGYSVFSANLTGIKAPYARLGLNSQGKSLGNLQFNMGYAFPTDYDPPTESEFWTTQGDNP